MAKLSLINREKKRADLVEKFAPKRAALKAIIANHSKRKKSTTKRASNCRRCRITRRRRASATAAP